MSQQQKIYHNLQQLQQHATNLTRSVPKTLPLGWKREESTRQYGLTSGKSEICYVSPTGQKIRSKLDLQRALGDKYDVSHFDWRSGTFNNTGSTQIMPAQQQAGGNQAAGAHHQSHPYYVSAGVQSASGGQAQRHAGNSLAQQQQVLRTGHQHAAGGPVSNKAPSVFSSRINTPIQNSNTSLTTSSHIVMAANQNNMQSNTNLSANANSVNNLTSQIDDITKLCPPMRQSAAMLKLPGVTVLRNHPQSKRSDIKHGPQDQPRQLFWEKRLEGGKFTDLATLMLEKQIATVKRSEIDVEMELKTDTNGENALVPKAELGDSFLEPKTEECKTEPLELNLPPKIEPMESVVQSKVAGCDGNLLVPKTASTIPFQLPSIIQPAGCPIMQPEQLIQSVAQAITQYAASKSASVQGQGQQPGGIILPITGQKSNRAAFEKNPNTAINCQQPMIKHAVITEDEVLRQKMRVDDARRKLALALNAFGDSAHRTLSERCG